MLRDVLLERRNGEVVLIIEDDGVGFDPSAMLRRPDERGMGVIGKAATSWRSGRNLIAARLPITEPTPPKALIVA